MAYLISKNSRLNEAFKDLRKAGYFARQNFLCCQSCAWAEIPEEKSDKVVFYHRQDAAGKDDNEMYLGWSGDGNEICNIFSKHRIDTEWDGDSSNRILISDYLY